MQTLICRVFFFVSLVWLDARFPSVVVVHISLDSPLALVLSVLDEVSWACTNSIVLQTGPNGIRLERGPQAGLARLCYWGILSFYPRTPESHGASILGLGGGRMGAGLEKATNQNQKAHALELHQFSISGRP